MLSQDITDAIQKNLSAEVGTVLRNRLIKAESDETLVADYRIQLEKNEQDILRLRETLSSYKNIAEREVQVKIDEGALIKQSWELKVKQAMLDGQAQGMQQNFEVVKAVFANSRLKYNEFGSSQFPVPNTGFVATGNFNKSVDVEG